MDDGTHHYHALDGLRGLAALIVVLQHTIAAFLPIIVGEAPAALARGHWEAHLLQTPASLLVSGSLAVAVFFVLSGFVLSAGFFRTHQRSRLVAMVVARYPRLMLPVLGSVLLACGLLAVGLMFHRQTAHLTGSTYWLARCWPFPPDWGYALYSGAWGVFFHPLGYAGQNPWAVVYTASLWTMQVEIFGSFLLFGLLMATGRWPERRRWLVHAVAALVLIKSNYLAFVLGIALSDIWHHHRLWLEQHRRQLIWLVLPGIPLALWQPAKYYATLFSPWRLPGWSQGDMMLLAHILAAAIILLMALIAPQLHALLTSKPLQWLGHRSFAIYLLHIPLIGSLGCGLYLLLYPLFGAYWTVAIVAPGLYAALAAASSAYMRFVDQPAIWLSRRVGQTAAGWWRACFYRQRSKRELT